MATDAEAGGARQGFAYFPQSAIFRQGPRPYRGHGHGYRGRGRGGGGMGGGGDNKEGFVDDRMDPSFDGKRMRKAINRKTIDYNPTIIHYLEVKSTILIYKVYKEVRFIK